MHWIDIAIIALIAFSTLISLVRGFIKEAVSLVVWGLAIFLALYLATDLGNAFLSSIKSNAARYAVSFIIILVATLVAGMIVNALISVLVKHTGVGAIDRLLGIIFGFARGYLVVAVLILLAGSTQIKQASWWQQSLLIPFFKPGVSWLSRILPEQVDQVSAWTKHEFTNSPDANKIKQLIPSPSKVIPPPEAPPKPQQVEH